MVPFTGDANDANDANETCEDEECKRGTTRFQVASPVSHSSKPNVGPFNDLERRESEGTLTFFAIWHFSNKVRRRFWPPLDAVLAHGSFPTFHCGQEATLDELLVPLDGNVDQNKSLGIR